VWLENRRLAKREYRETLMSLIEDLQRQVSGLQTRVGNLRVELAHLEEALSDERRRSDELDQENSRLRARLLEVDPGDPHREV
jgi:chromosome segregation ATPase